MYDDNNIIKMHEINSLQKEVLYQQENCLIFTKLAVRS